MAKHEWNSLYINGAQRVIEGHEDDKYTLRVFPHADQKSWRFELLDQHAKIHRTFLYTESPGIDDALAAGLRWSQDACRNYNGWRGGWHTWHLVLENDNDASYYDEYTELVTEYNDALADKPKFNQEQIREALSRHFAKIIHHSDADYILHNIDWAELWEHFLDDAKEAREYDK